MTEILTRYDPADTLVDEETVAVFLTDALETADASFIAHAVGIVARASRSELLNRHLRLVLPPRPSKPHTT